MTSPRIRLALAPLAGVALALAAPPVRFWPATFVSAGLLATALLGATPRRAFAAGWMSGTVATLISCNWIIGTVHRFTTLPLAAAITAYALLAMIAGLTLGIASYLAARASPVLGAPLALAAAVVIAERWAPSIFPWQFASPMIFAPAWPQAADLVGVSGLSALMIGAISWIVALLGPRSERATHMPRSTRLRRAAIAASILLLPFAYGALRTRQIRRARAAAPALRVALVQPAIGARVRWDDSQRDAIVQTLRGLTDRASRASQPPELIVWSETAYPYLVPHRAGWDGEAGPPMMPRWLEPELLAGVVSVDMEGRAFNSALIRDSNGRLSAPVSKRVLVPFGEYIPFVWRFAWFRRTFPLASGVTPANEPEILRSRTGLRLGVLNCFEDTLSYVAADVAHADLLVNITNDAWFGDGQARWLHLMLARWRAIEARRDLLRAVNTGVTAHIDAVGQLVVHAVPGDPTVLHAQPRIMNARPLARHVVVVLPYVCVLAIAGAWGVSLVRRRRSRAPTEGGESRSEEPA